MFIVYVMLVNAVWSVVLLTFSINAKDGFLMAPTFYIFNGLMLFTFFLMFQRYGERLLWLTVRLVLVSVFIQLAFAFLARASVGRATVMFNNANQLGYYALLSACVLLLGQKRLKLSTLQITAGLAACSYLALLSASKAALTSVVALGVTLLISRLRTIVVVALVFGVLIFTSNPFSAAIERAQQRIDNDQSFGFVEERGYDRIIDYPSTPCSAPARARTTGSRDQPDRCPRAALVDGHAVLLLRHRRDRAIRRVPVADDVGKCPELLADRRYRVRVQHDAPGLAISSAVAAARMVAALHEVERRERAARTSAQVPR